MVWRGELPEDSLRGFWHHGIRLRDGSVIHYSGMDGPKTLHNARILHTQMGEFLAEPNRTIHVVRYPSSVRRFSEEEIERRARNSLGTQGYHLLYQNCENFARWCVTGRSSSCQSQGAVIGLAGALVCMGLGGGLLGSILTAVVAQKAWDNARNRSDTRAGLSGEDSDDDDTSPH
ncbi:Lecithin retinol acyltransferase [Gracilaria domingensis]|nr:Lecithin retinol acyltransferase [Gracilaria domingensis]